MARLKKLTHGSISLIKDGRVSITGHQETLGLLDDSYALIISSRSKFLRIITLPSEVAVMIRVSIDLESFTETARILYSEVKNRSIQILHSTGFCPLKDYCLWECYFTSVERNKVEEFIEWIRDLDAVQEAEIVYLETK
ncbi:MAG: hypothetical protein ACTSU3_06860 [Candidatus Thorarchaeota archaeon]